MLIRVVMRVARRLPQRIAADWTTIAAVALAVVLVHSAMLHLAPSAALEAHYLERFGAAHWTRLIGIAQLAIALGLLLRRTRATACAMLIAAVTTALLWRTLDGLPLDGGLPSVAMIGAAIIIAVGETRRGRRTAMQGDYSRRPDG